MKPSIYTYMEYEGYEYENNAFGSVIHTYKISNGSGGYVDVYNIGENEFLESLTYSDIDFEVDKEYLGNNVGRFLFVTEVDTDNNYLQFALDKEGEPIIVEIIFDLDQ